MKKLSLMLFLWTASISTLILTNSSLTSTKETSASHLKVSKKPIPSAPQRKLLSIFATDMEKEMQNNEKKIEEIDVELNELKDNDRVLRAVKSQVDELKDRVERYEKKIYENLSSADMSFHELNDSV